MNEECGAWGLKALAWEKKYRENYDEVLNYELYAQKQFSVHNTVVFFIYGMVCSLWNRFVLNTSGLGSMLCMGVCLLSMTDYAICKVFLESHIRYATAVTNVYIFILGVTLLSIDLIWNDGYGGNVSWTLLVCSLISTSIICIVPSHYIITLLCVVALDTIECISSEQDIVASLYNLLDGVLIVIFGVGMNIIYSKYKYAEFGRRAALQLENSRDVLTNLYNRRYIESYYELYAKPENMCAILVLDLDNFKMANDVYGHKKGDEVLCTVSDILSKSFRNEDCVVRLGGDEFAVFLPKISQKEIVVGRVRDVLRKFPIVIDEEQDAKESEHVEVSVSIGIAFKNRGEEIDYAKLCDKADEAMYRAKRLGKGKAVVGAERNRKELVIAA
jgi:diguanylate cyclase (GGDEF)-like protein